MRKIIYAAAIAVASFIGFSACSEQPKQDTTAYPTFWTWLDYRAGMNFDSICQVMEDMGMDGIMLNAPTPDDYRVAVPIANKHGIEVHAWLWTMNLEHGRDSIVAAHPEWLSVNRLGHSLADTTAYVGYYKFMCPALPEVRQYLKDKVKAYCEVPGLNGIAIDYHRFVDVVLPTSLWPRYGVVQDREYPDWDYGYHPAMIEKFKEQYGYDPREQEDPTMDLKWRQFRCDMITEVANEIAEVVHSYGKAMSASPFPTPKMSARMVRQDWGKWNLDIVFPMVYDGFYTFDTSFIRDCMIEDVRDKNEQTVLGCGMSAADGPLMFERMDAAFNNGAQAISMFTVATMKDPEIRKQFRVYADSVKAGKKANGGKIIAQVPERASDDLFKDHETVIEKINQKMASLIEAETVQIKDYVFTGQENVTRTYDCKDELSGKTFVLSVWMYGDIVSGWDVALKE